MLSHQKISGNPFTGQLGDTLVTMTDDQGESEQFMATVTVVDNNAPDVTTKSGVLTNSFMFYSGAASTSLGTNGEGPITTGFGGRGGADPITMQNFTVGGGPCTDYIEESGLEHHFWHNRQIPLG